MAQQARRITDAAGREVWVDAAGNEIRDVTPNPPVHENDLGALQTAAAKRGTGMIPTNPAFQDVLRGLMTARLPGR